MFIRGRTLLVVSGLGSTLPVMTVRGLRGLVDFDDLLAEAVGAWDAYRLPDQPAREARRFRVEVVVGAEKGLAGFSRNMVSQRIQGTQGSPPSHEPAVGAAPYNAVQPRAYHESFLYPRKLYTEDADDDPLQTLYFEPEVHQRIEETPEMALSTVSNDSVLCSVRFSRPQKTVSKSSNRTTQGVCRSPHDPRNSRSESVPR